MHYSEDTIAAISTGSQISAIGIVRISGSNAISAAEKIFRPFSKAKLSECEDRKLIYGEVRDHKDELIDICLCTISRAPNSYTGEDTAEFQCHGSPVVLQTVLRELFLLGVRQAEAGEFTKRAFLNGKMELTSAEAVADIIDAETVDEVKNAAGQLSGAISKKTDVIYSGLTDICSHYHAVLDYPDEDIEPFVMENYKSEINGYILTLEKLLKSFERGKIMKSGIQTAIIGRPNAGKSSLLNALLGYERAIVTDIPGTTRDTVEEKVIVGGKCLRLIDTAGIRDAENEIERLGVERSRKAIDASELIIAVFDGAAALQDEDKAILEAAEKAKQGIVVISKNDLPDYNGDIIKTGLPVINLSAVTGEGLSDLEETIKDMFPYSSNPNGDILTNSRQAEAVAEALDYLKAALNAINLGETPDIVLTEAEGALNAIGALNGKNIREDITNRIFARFCVGK